MALASKTTLRRSREEGDRVTETSTDIYRASKRLRFLMFFYGVLGPVLCFMFTYAVGLSVSGPWQSGEAKHYFEVLLSPPAHLAFVPLVIYSAGCLAGWLVRPERAKQFPIRLGVYTGLLLSIQFLVFVVIVSGYLTFLLALFAGPISLAVVYGGTAIIRRWKRFSILHLLVLTTVVAIGVTIYQLVDIEDEYWAAPLFAVPATPALCPIVYAFAALRVAERSLDCRTSPQIRLLVWIGWPLAWLASWKFALDIMLIEYQKLPTTSPRCYVSAAASQGHRCLVGENLKIAGTHVVTLQMQRLKFLEFALAAAAPAIHCSVRRWYNCFGPPLARFCSGNVWFCDLTYVMLLPLELVARAIQRLGSIGEVQIQNIYRDSRVFRESADA
jgi:hypothetical protein